MFENPGLSRVLPEPGHIATGYLWPAMREREMCMPSKLWERLAALEHACDLRIERLRGQRTPGRASWRVSVLGRGSAAGARIAVEGANLAAVLRFVAYEAEQRAGELGWARSPTGPGDCLVAERASQAAGAGRGAPDDGPIPSSPACDSGVL